MLSWRTGKRRAASSATEEELGLSVHFSSTTLHSKEKLVLHLATQRLGCELKRRWLTLPADTTRVQSGGGQLVSANASAGQKRRLVVNIMSKAFRRF